MELLNDYVTLNEIKCFNKVGKCLIFIYFLLTYTYKLFKAFPPYFTGSDIYHKSSFGQQKTVIEWIFYWTPQLQGGGDNYYFYWSFVYKYITGNAWVSALQKGAC